MVTPLQSTCEATTALVEMVALAILDGLLETPDQSTEAANVADAIKFGLFETPDQSTLAELIEYSALATIPPPIAISALAARRALDEVIAELEINALDDIIALLDIIALEDIVADGLFISNQDDPL